MEIGENMNSTILDEIYMLMQFPQIFEKLIFVRQRNF